MLSNSSFWDYTACLIIVCCPELKAKWNLEETPIQTGNNFHFFHNELLYVAAAAKSLQPCPTLCDPIDGSPPGSPVPGILQARTLEWVVVSFSNAWKWKVKGKSLSRIQLFATPWTAAYQAPLSMGFSKQEYWSGMPLPYPVYVAAFGSIHLFA